MYYRPFQILLTGSRHEALLDSQHGGYQPSWITIIDYFQASSTVVSTVVSTVTIISIVNHHWPSLTSIKLLSTNHYQQIWSTIISNHNFQPLPIINHSYQPYPTTTSNSQPPPSMNHDPLLTHDWVSSLHTWQHRDAARKPQLVSQRSRQQIPREAKRPSFAESISSTMMVDTGDTSFANWYIHVLLGILHWPLRNHYEISKIGLNQRFDIAINHW